MHAQSGDPYAADELVELFNELVQTAETEDDLSAVLAQVEDVIVNDIVRSASSTSHFAAPDTIAPTGSVSELFLFGEPSRSGLQDPC